MAQKIILLDTSAMVGIFRGDPAVLKKLKGFSATQLMLPAIVEMELLQGAWSHRHQAQLLSSLRAHPVVEINENISQSARKLFATLHLSNGMGIQDALIAATALNLNLPLYTLNRKHFRNVPGIQLI